MLSSSLFNTLSSCINRNIRYNCIFYSSLFSLSSLYNNNLISPKNNPNCHSILSGFSTYSLSSLSSSSSSIIDNKSNSNNYNYSQLGSNELLTSYKESDAEEFVSRLYAFWFRSQFEANNIINYDSLYLWFSTSNYTNKLIAAEFGRDLILYLNEKELGINSHYTDLESSPQGLLALIILLSNLSIRIFPDNQPFYYYLLNECEKLFWFGVDRNISESLSGIEKFFFYFPLIKSEDLFTVQFAANKLQFWLKLPTNTAFKDSNGKSIIESNGDYIHPIHQPFLQEYHSYAIKHIKLLKEFGRLPSRNQALNRVSTKQELLYLQDLQQNQYEYQTALPKQTTRNDNSNNKSLDNTRKTNLSLWDI
jgi:uncharacterized protein (DUF924 family)